MLTQIIAEICPAPECDLSTKEVEQFVEELEAYHKAFIPAFRRREQASWSKVYLRGLLGDSPRKTIERIALDLDVNVRNLQHFIGQSRWQNEPVIAVHQRLVGEALGEEDGSSMPILGFTDNLKHSYRVLNLSFAYMFGMDVGLLRKGKSTKGAKIKTKNVGGKSSKPKNINTFKKRKN